MKASPPPIPFDQPCLVALNFLSAYTYTDGIASFDNVAVSGYFPYLVHDGMIGIPLARFARLVSQNATALSAYVTQANFYRTFLETHVIPRWETSPYIGNTWVNVSSTAGYYRESANFDTFATPIYLEPLPYNQFLAFAEMLMILFDVNGLGSYRDKATQMNSYFKLSLEPNGSAYTWHYAAYDADRVEDASHSNLDINSAVAMFNHGYGVIFSGMDMKRLTNTLTVQMWNQSQTAPKIHNSVDGTEGSWPPYSYTLDMPGWTKLAQFDRRVWHIAAYQYDDSTFNAARALEGLVLTEIMKWDPVKLVNQGFELRASTDGSLPARWLRAASTASTAYRDAAHKASGNFGLTLVSNGATAQRLVQQWAEWVPSVPYVVTFDGKTDGSGAGGKVWVYNQTTGTTLGGATFTGTSWKTYQFTFTSPASTSHVVKVYLGHNNLMVSNGKTYFDNVVIKRWGDVW